MTPPKSRPRPTPLADLKLLRYYRAAESLRVGRQTYAVEVSGSAVVFGANLVAAAFRELGPVAGDAARGSRRETAGVRS